VQRCVFSQHCTLQYNHIPQKKISVIVDNDGNEKIDIAELERVYGKETVQKNLLKEKDKKDAHVQDSHTEGAKGVKFEILMLKEKLNHLEEQKKQQETYYNRERELLQEEVENLRDGLKKAQEHHNQLSLLLTDQREDKEDRVGEQERRLQALEKANEDLKKQNRRVLYELKAQQEASLWEKLFGKKDSSARKYGN
jgi:hypothetical protein